MGKSEQKVSDLVAKIRNGELLLPEMQRSYVWKSKDVRNLFDSLYRGYPSGVILAWETDEPVETREFAISTAVSPTRPLLLLDGQQRLTSLASVMNGEGVKVKDRKREISLLFNLEHPEELPFASSESSDEDGEQPSEHDRLSESANRLAFVVKMNRLASQPQWVEVSDIFQKSDASILKAAGITDLEDPRYEKYQQRLQKVRAIGDYVYRMDILERTMSYEEVTEIFVRVNSLGVTLRASDLALAQITAKWRGALETFSAYQDGVVAEGLSVDLSILLRTLVALITGQAKFSTVNSLTEEQLKDGWRRTEKAFDFAVSFLKANLHIDSLSLLSSPYLLTTLAYWADHLDYQITSEEEESFRRWFLNANAKARYAGSSETKLSQDLAVIRNGGGGEELLERLSNDVGRLYFTASELRGRNTSSGAFKTLFMALRQDAAKDWASDLVIAPSHKGKTSKIEYHHIFPKAYLEKSREDLDRQQINQIGNMAFIGAATNKKISASAPSVYRTDFAEHHFDAQLIDFSGGKDLPENYEDFIDKRLDLMARRINGFLSLDVD